MTTSHRRFSLRQLMQLGIVDIVIELVELPGAIIPRPVHVVFTDGSTMKIGENDGLVYLTPRPPLDFEALARLKNEGP